MNNPIKAHLDALYLKGELSKKEFAARIEGILDGFSLIQAFGADLVQEITAATKGAKSAAEVDIYLSEWIDELVESHEWPEPPELVQEILWN